MKKLRRWLQQHARLILLTAGGTLFSGALLGIHLGGLTNGISKREVLLNQQASSLPTILHDPVGLPLTLLQWVVGILPFHGDTWLRVPSAILALVTLFCLTYIMRRWYGPRTAFFGFVLFATSAWFLHVGRLATTDILYLGAVPVLLFSHLLLHNNLKSRRAAYVWLICNISLLYIPGVVWFVLLNAWWQRSDIKEVLGSLKSWLARVGLVATGILFLAPLLYGLLMGSAKTIGLELLGLPTAVPSLSMVGGAFRDAVLFVAIRGNAPSDIWLNHLPILDAFVTVLFLAGVYFYGSHWRASRARLLASFLILGVLLVVGGGLTTISILVPLLYLIAAAGIAYLLHQWLVVFPRNPLARGFGIGLLSIVVLASCLYGLRQYFVAWVHHPETQSSFSEHKIEPSHR